MTAQNETLQEKVEALGLKPLAEVIENGEINEFFNPEQRMGIDIDEMQEQYQWVRKNNVYSTEYLEANNLEYLQEQMISVQ